MTVVAPKPVRLTGIDSDNLEDDGDIPEAVRFSVTLDAEPSTDWIHEFNYAYSTEHHPIKPPVSITGDRIWIAYLPRYTAELQGYLGFLKKVVEKANAEELRTAHIQESDNTGHKAKFRDVLKGISLP